MHTICVFVPLNARASRSLSAIAECLVRLHMEEGTDSNCVSNDDAEYCADGQNKVTFESSDDDVDKAQSSRASIVSATASISNVRRNSRHIVVSSSAVDEGTHRAVRAAILMLALSLHHLFEGISLGLQWTVTGALMLLIALLCHETIISFSLGLQFVKCSYTIRQHYITAFLCSIVEPIGVAVGKSHSA